MIYDFFTLKQKIDKALYFRDYIILMINLVDYDKKIDNICIEILNYILINKILMIYL